MGNSAPCRGGGVGRADFAGGLQRWLTKAVHDHGAPRSSLFSRHSQCDPVTRSWPTSIRARRVARLQASAFVTAEASAWLSPAAHSEDAKPTAAKHAADKTWMTARRAARPDDWKGSRCGPMEPRCIRTASPTRRRGPLTLCGAAISRPAAQWQSRPVAPQEAPSMRVAPFGRPSQFRDAASDGNAPPPRRL